jgi:hypothetical protein
MIVLQPAGEAHAWPVYAQPDPFLRLGQLVVAQHVLLTDPVLHGNAAAICRGCESGAGQGAGCPDLGILCVHELGDGIAGCILG